MPQQTGGAGGSSDKGTSDPRVRRAQPGDGKPSSGGGGGGGGGRSSSSYGSGSGDTSVSYAPPIRAPQQPTASQIQQKRAGLPQPTRHDNRIAKRIQEIRDYRQVPLTERYGYDSSQVRLAMQERLDILDETTGGSLNPDILIALAQVDVYEKDLREVSNTLARRFDPPVGVYADGYRVKTGDPKEPWEYVDPFTGQAISARDAKQYFPIYERAFWANLLASTPDNLTEKSTSPRGPGRAGTLVRSDEPIDPIWVGAGFGVIAKHIGRDVSFKQGISVAVSIAQREVNTGLMDRNMPAFLKAFPPKKAIAAAQLSAELGREVSTPQEAQAFLAEAITGDPKAQEKLDAARQLLDGGSKQAAEKLGAENVEEYQRKLSESGALDGYQPYYDAVLNASTNAGAVQNLQTEYDQYIKSVLDARVNDPTNTDGMDLYSLPVVGPVIHAASAAYQAWDRTVFEPVRHVALDVTNETIYNIWKVGGGGKDAAKWHEEAVDAANAIKNDSTEDFYGFLTDTYGFSPMQAMLYDLAVTWYADPFIVGGKAFKVAKVGRYNPNSILYKFGNGPERFANFGMRQLTKQRALLGDTLVGQVMKSAKRAAEGKIYQEDAGRILGAIQDGPQKRTALYAAIKNGDVEPGALNKSDFSQAYGEAALKAGNSPEDLAAWEKMNGKGVFKDKVTDPEELWTHHRRTVQADNEAGFREIQRLFKHRWRSWTIDDQMLSWIFDYVRVAGGKIDDAELYKHIEGIFETSLGKNPPADTAAYQFLKDMNETAAAKPKPKTNYTMDDVSVEAIKNEADFLRSQDLIDSYFGFGQNYEHGLALMNIPRANLLQKFRARMGNTDSGWWERAGNTRFATALDALRTRYRDPYVRIEDDFANTTANLLRRSREFSRDEVSYYERQALEIARPGTARREERFKELLTEVENTYWRRIGQRTGMDNEVIDAFLKARDEYLMKSPSKGGLGGRFGSGEEAVKAMWDTQLRNRALMTDPVWVRHTLHSHVRSTRLLRNASRRALGKKPLPISVDKIIAERGSKVRIADGKIVNTSRATRSAVGDTVRASIDGFYRLWKPAVVVTPRYIGRVVMTNETARFAADVSLLGRIRSGKMWAQAGKVADKTPLKNLRPYVTMSLDPVRSMAVYDDLARVGFTSLDQATAAVQSAAKAARSGAPIDSRVQKLTGEVRGLLASSTLRGGMDTTDNVLAGRRFISDLPSEAFEGGLKDGYIFQQSSGKVPDGGTEVVLVARNPLTPKKRADYEKYKNFKGSPSETNAYVDELGYDAVVDSDGVRVWDSDQVIFNPNDRMEVRLYKPRPGDILDDDAVRPGLGQSEFFETFQRLQQSEMRRIQEKEFGWGSVLPGDKQYYGVWAHHLNNTLGRSVVARKVMINLNRGGDIDGAVRELMAFWRTDEGKKLIERIGISDVAGYSRQAVDEIAHVTAFGTGNTELIDLALKHQLTPEYLDNWSGVQGIQDNMPELHGLNVERAGGHNTNLFSRAWDRYYKFIMQDATNRMVRQPFFKKHYNDARWIILKQAEANGVELTPDLLRGIEGQSRGYAQQRVKDVMFDFAEQSRFAELLHYVAPFAQPFFEEYTVWGKLLLDNPQLVPEFMRVREAAMESGFIEQDELTGQWQFALPHWAGANIWNHFLPSEGGLLPGYSIWGNLGSINMFTNNVLNLPTEDLAGFDVPLPLPGFNPLLNFATQNLADSEMVPNWLKPNLMDWAFQYGRQDLNDLMPAWLKEGLTGASVYAGLGWTFGQEDVITSLKNEFIKEMYVRGVTVQDLMESRDWTANQAKTFIEREAEKQAGLYMGLKGFTRMYMPLSFQIEGPLQEYTDELRGYFQQYDYKTAVEKFKENHEHTFGDSPDGEPSPALMALTLSETYWAGSEDPSVAAESGAIPLPANEKVMALMEDEGFRQYMKDNPMFAFAVLPDELWDEEFDRQAYFEQIDKGWRLPKDSFDFLDELDEKLYLDSYIGLQDKLNRNRQALTAAGIPWDSVTGTVGYKGGMGTAEYGAALKQLRDMYPGADQRIAQAERVGVDMKTMGQLHELLKTPIARSTELGQATWKYMQGAQEILEKMYENNVYDLETSAAYELGLKEDVYELEQEVLEQHPSFSRVKDLFFDDFFSNVPVEKSELESKISPDEEAAVYRYDKKFSEYWTASIDTVDPDKKKPFYQKMRRLSYGSYFEDPINTQELWGEYVLGQENLKEYERGARVRPYAFMSVYDRKLLGIPTNRAAERRWLQVGELELDIARITAANPNAATGDLYEQRDRYVREYMKESKVFAQQVKQANIWGYAFFNKNPWVDGDTDAARAWRAFEKSISNAQGEADRLEMFGEHDFNEKNKAQYVTMKQEISAHVESLMEYSGIFERQWRAADEAYGGDLIDYFIPEYYFKLGGRANGR